MARPRDAGAAISIGLDDFGISNVGDATTDDGDDDNYDDDEYDDDEYEDDIASRKQVCQLRRVTMDAIFLIDGSYSITPKDFRRGLRFVATFIDFLLSNGIQLGENDTRIAVIQFSDDVDVSMGMGRGRGRERG